MPACAQSTQTPVDYKSYTVSSVWPNPLGRFHIRMHKSRPHLLYTLALTSQKWSLSSTAHVTHICLAVCCLQAISLITQTMELLDATVPLIVSVDGVEAVV